MALPTLPAYYEIQEEVGRGAKGVVYRAYNSRLQREVAVKVLIDSDESEQQRFQQEAHLLERLYHPNVVACLESSTTYLVLEFVGGNLYEFLRSKPSLLETCRVFAQIARGLDYIHNHDLIHRDLKPENILLTREWVPKITDFGTARQLGGGEVSRLTCEGGLVGTWGYLSPEQIQGSPIAPAADLYALGVCLYEAVTGQPPFQGATQIAMAVAHVHETPASPRSLRPDTPVELDRLIMRLLKKSPGERPGSAEEVAARLDEISVLLTPPGRAEVALRGRSDILDELTRLLQEGSLTLILTGSTGAGSSTLLRKVLQRLPLQQVHRLGPEGNQDQQGLANVWAALAGGGLEELGNAFLAGGPQAAALLIRRHLQGLLLVDDFERLDPTTQAVVQALVKMPSPTRGGWLVATGKSGAARLVAHKSGALKLLELPPLAEEDLLVIAEEVVEGWPEGPADLAPDIISWILEQCGGAPRRLKLLLLSLRGRGAISHTSGGAGKGQWVWREMPPDGETSWESVLREISRLDEAPRQLIRFAALTEEPIPYAILLEGSGLSEDDVEESLERLLLLGLFEEIWTTRGDSYRFSAAEVKAELARTHPEASALYLHGRIASTLETLQASPSQRGHHLALARRYAEAMPLLQQAAQQSQDRGLLAEAAGHWQAALKCADPKDSDTCAYYLTRALECLARGQQDGEAHALFLFSSKLIESASPPWRLEIVRWWGLSQVQGVGRPGAPGVRDVRVWLDLLVNDIPLDPRELVSGSLSADLAPTVACIYLALAATSGDQAEAAHGYFQAAVTLLWDTQDHFLTALALRAQGRFYLGQGQLEKARECLKESLLRTPALAVQQRLATLPDLAASYGRSEWALVAYEEALALAEELGELRFQATARIAMADFRWQEGDTEGAVALLSAGLDALRAGGLSELGGSLLRLGELVLVGGQAERAETLLMEAVQVGDIGEVAASQFALGWMGWEAQDFERAIEWLQKALSSYREAGVPLGASRTLSLLSTVARARNRMGEALTQAEEALAALTGLGSAPLEQGLARAAKGFVGLRLKHKQAWADLQEAQSWLSLGGMGGGPVTRCHRLTTLVEVEEALERAQPTAPERPELRRKSTLGELEAEALAPDLELEVWGAPEVRVPLREASFRIGGADGDLPLAGSQQLSLNWRLGGWILRSLEPNQTVRVNGLAVNLANLKVGDRFQVGDRTVELTRASQPRAWLEGLTAPHLGQSWGLRLDQESSHYPVGAPGGRANRIELQDSKSGHELATLYFQEDQVWVRRDGSGECLRNGFEVREGALYDGDFLRLGEHFFRFRVARPPAPLTPLSVLVLRLDAPAGQWVEAFDLAVEALRRREGRLLPYSGEALVAVFRDGNHAGKALDAARNIRLRLRSRNVTTQVGIHTGEAPLRSSETAVRFAQVEEVALAAYDLVGAPGIFLSAATLAQLPRTVTAQKLPGEVYQVG